jgi:hypothetical protein
MGTGNEIVPLSSATGLSTGRLLSAGKRVDPAKVEVDVLKITRTETPAEEKWILQGRLVGLWVGELRRSWKKTHQTDNNLKCVVDLNEVTCIDKKGEMLLRTMSKQGAQFIATGIYIKHVLQQRCAR